MYTLILSYHSDLLKRNIKLEERIREISDKWIEILPNSWYITTYSTTMEVTAFLSDTIENEDKLMVTSTNGECSCLGIDERIIKFLDENS